MQSLFKLTPSRLILCLVIVMVAAVVVQYFSRENEDNITVRTDDTSGISLFHAEKPEKGLLIYISDNTSANSKNSRQFAQLSYYVAHIAPEALLTSQPDSCINIAERLASIASQLQKTYGIAQQDLPILVGNNAGAALVYTALAQASSRQFHAGISLNFNAKIEGKLSLCATHNFASSIANSDTEVFPVKHLPASWYVFQNGNAARDANTNQFLANISNAKLTASEQKPIAALDETLQILQWLDPRLADQISSDNSDTDLPVIEIPADSDQETLAVLLTGDGGWAEIDKRLAKLLADQGIPTLALDSLSYFWKARTPQETAKDVDNLISLYSEKWHKKNVILIGYSFGADVLPFIANQLSEANKNKLALIALLGMGNTAAFEFRLASWMNADTSEHRLPLLPEVENMRWANSVCIYGTEDTSSACAKTAALGVKVISMKGDHHFDENYNLLVKHILDNVKIPAPVESEASEAAATPEAAAQEDLAPETGTPQPTE